MLVLVQVTLGKVRDERKGEANYSCKKVITYNYGCRFDKVCCTMVNNLTCKNSGGAMWFRCPAGPESPVIMVGEGGF